MPHANLGNEHQRNKPGSSIALSRTRCHPQFGQIPVSEPYSQRTAEPEPREQSAQKSPGHFSDAPKYRSSSSPRAEGLTTRATISMFESSRFPVLIGADDSTASCSRDMEEREESNRIHEHEFVSAHFCSIVRTFAGKSVKFVFGAGDVNRIHGTRAAAARQVRNRAGWLPGRIIWDVQCASRGRGDQVRGIACGRSLVIEDVLVFCPDSQFSLWGFFEVAAARQDARRFKIDDGIEQERTDDSLDDPRFERCAFAFWQVVRRRDWRPEQLMRCRSTWFGARKT